SAAGRDEAVKYLTAHWPSEPARLTAYTQLAGALLRSGLSPEQVEAFAAALAQRCRGGGAGRRVAQAREVVRGPRESWPSWRALSLTLGSNGGAVTAQLRKLLGVTADPCEHVHVSGDEGAGKLHESGQAERGPTGTGTRSSAADGHTPDQ